MIEIKDLTYSYQKDAPNEKAALKNINLTIPDGSVTAIIGHTGSGKSTLIQHLNGLLRPDSGDVVIDGENIKNFKIKDICKKVGIVFQYPENQLFEETVYKDIAFGPRNMGLDEKEVKKRVLSAAAMVKLNEETLLKSPFELSGGQMRRAAIAGALAMKPKILILDEPMAGLDGVGKAAVIEMIRNFCNKDKSRTVIFVSHSMEDTGKIAEQIIVMNDGQIEMRGSPDEVFSKEMRLREIGLDIPQITHVMKKLRALGYDVSEKSYTVKAAAEEINRLLAGGKNA